MKRIITLIAVGFLATTILVASIDHYQANQKTAEQATAKQDAAVVAAAEQSLRAEQARQATLIKSYNKLFAECEKGVAIYNGLPAATKTKTVAPVCGAEIVQ